MELGMVLGEMKGGFRTTYGEELVWPKYIVYMYKILKEITKMLYWNINKPWYTHKVENLQYI